MKKFMMIFISANYEELGLSPEQTQEKMGQWFAWQNKMSEAGILHDGNALTSQVRRVSGSERTVSDLASTELKELVGGYYIVDAESFDSVVDIAQGYPDYDLGGTVEIREIMVYEQ